MTETYGKTKQKLDYIRNEVTEWDDKFVKFNKDINRNTVQIQQMGLVVSRIDARHEEFKQMLEFAAKSICGLAEDEN